MKPIEERIVNANENIIIHQVNCIEKHSTFNKSIFEAYPKALEEYNNAFNMARKAGIKPIDLLGEVQFVEVEPNKYVVNMFSQSSVRKRPCDKAVYTKYNAMESCLQEINKFAVENDYTIALPFLIGSGAPNGNWSIIEDIIKENLTVKYNYYRIR